MFLGYVQNHMDSTYQMLNLCTNHVVLSHGVIWPQKTYCNYVSINQHMKEDDYFLQDKDESNIWDNENLFLSRLKMSRPIRIIGGKNMYRRPWIPFIFKNNKDKKTKIFTTRESIQTRMIFDNPRNLMCHIILTFFTT